VVCRCVYCRRVPAPLPAACDEWQKRGVSCIRTALDMCARSRSAQRFHQPPASPAQGRMGATLPTGLVHDRPLRHPDPQHRCVTHGAAARPQSAPGLDHFAWSGLGLGRAGIGDGRRGRAGAARARVAERRTGHPRRAGAGSAAAAGTGSGARRAGGQRRVADAARRAGARHCERHAGRAGGQGRPVHTDARSGERAAAAAARRLSVQRSGSARAQ
jgi:hypothetical protein